MHREHRHQCPHVAIKRTRYWCWHRLDPGPMSLTVEPFDSDQGSPVTQAMKHGARRLEDIQNGST